MDVQPVEAKDDTRIQSDVERGGNRGKTKGRISIAKDAINKRASDGSIGGTYYIFADKVENTVNFNFG
ncbi:p7 [Honeysuckle ringspot virus]|uniref:p7 n=1 Tax=Honeysuckle ringspot virus TaxID=943272 RepID=E7EEK6_9TOMB|nr:p7 [Honeysuckle ringspot virus]ADV15470.1 p7 [Honeysuckle ringspot virus]